METSRETDARMVVDQLLQDAGWNIFDKSQVSTEEPTADGRADYLLKSTLTRPLAVVEAKRFSKDPYGAKAQTLPYAQNLGAPFIILTNGREHYFWDYGEGDARPILGFPSRTDLETRANLKFQCRGFSRRIDAADFEPGWNRTPAGKHPARKGARQSPAKRLRPRDGGGYAALAGSFDSLPGISRAG